MRRTEDDALVRRLSRVKGSAPHPSPTIGGDLVAFFKNSVAKRQAKFGKIGECWSQLIPSTLLEHTALESFTRGSLTVIVDSSSHLYELKQLLLAGLQQQILIACRSAGLRKITLRAGRWYEGEGAEKRFNFD
jgi:hypothetical protein